MKESYFIGVSEVQEIVGCSKSRAYQFIQQMNKELEAKCSIAERELYGETDCSPAFQVWAYVWVQRGYAGWKACGRIRCG